MFPQQTLKLEHGISCGASRTSVQTALLYTEKCQVNPCVTVVCKESLEVSDTGCRTMKPKGQLNRNVLSDETGTHSIPDRRQKQKEIRRRNRHYAQEESNVNRTIDSSGPSSSCILHLTNRKAKDFLCWARNFKNINPVRRPERGGTIQLTIQQSNECSPNVDRDPLQVSSR